MKIRSAFSGSQVVPCGQTDRQKDRQKDRKTDRQNERQKNRETHTERQTDSQTHMTKPITVCRNFVKTVNKRISLPAIL